MEIWRKIPTFPDYEISSIGRVRRISTNRLLEMQYAKGGDSTWVQLSYKGKTYGRSVGKLMRIVFGIKDKPARGGNRAAPKEVFKEGYFKF